MTTGVFVILLVATSAFVHSVSGQDGLCSFCGPNEVTADTLPGYVGPNPFPFRSYTGYVQVNITHHRNNFYWLVESQSDHPEQDPLVFWYQGGPGCSGLWGMFTENGPFHLQQNGNVTLSPLSWNKVANIVYLEQPCGVGFSFVGHQGHIGGPDYDDQLTAEENASFIEGFLQAHPQYIGRDTWFTGESYAGVYIPTLTALILSNTSYTVNPQLVGFMAGNPAISCPINNSLDVDMNYYFGRSLISYGSLSAWNNANCPDFPEKLACQKILDQAIVSMGNENQEIGGWRCVNNNCKQPSLDPDCLYQDFFAGNATLEWMVEHVGDGYQNADTLTTHYLSRVDVQQAIGAKAPDLGSWYICNGPLYQQSHENMIPYYQYVLDTRPGFRILVYSGDTDIATVPGPPTQICLATLNGTLVEGRAWQPWFVNGATAGYVEVYDKYTYATVKAAGHSVPLYQPLTSFNMFSRFLANQTLDGGQIYFPPSTTTLQRRRRQGDVLREYGVGMAQHFPKKK